MTNVMAKAIKISEHIYAVIIVNVLFLITNCLFFQIFFSIDFKPVFFPLYFLVSLPVLPSVISSFQTVKEFLNGNSEGYIRSYFLHLKKIVSKNGKWLFWLPLLMFVTLFNLYSITVSNPLLLLLFSANLVLFLGESLLAVNCVFVSLRNENSCLVVEATRTLFSNSLIVCIGLAITIAVTWLLFKISFFSWLFVFGIQIYGWAWFHQLSLNTWKE